MKTIQPARLRWSDDGQPWAEDFDDCYFSRIDGLAETRHVFLDGNHLSERWQNSSTDHFCIGETGFGSGLNFVAAWQLWEKTPKFQAHFNTSCAAHLTFVSAELHPLCKDDLIKAAALWPELASYYAQLVNLYPALTPGFHTLRFERVTLLLMLGDATEVFQQWLATDHPDFQRDYNGCVDAWFLDGFAPAKNPALWTESLIHTLAQLSKPNTTLATFSAAGQMRRSLATAGFRVEKQSGFANKREMVTAIYSPEHDSKIASSMREQPAFVSSPYQAPWYLDSRLSFRTPREILTTQSEKIVTVIGAGIAGCTVADALARRGFQVTVIDAQDKPATQASGNVQAVLYNKFSASDDDFAQFNLASYLFAMNFYRQLLKKNPELPIHLCGVLQLAWSEREQQAQQSLLEFLSHYPEIAEPLMHEQASQLAGIAVDHDGLFFRQAGWINPTEICEHLLQHENISCRFNQPIDSLHYQNNHWHLAHGAQTVLRSSHVVIANARHCTSFAQTAHLPLRLIRGQVTHAEPTHLSVQLNTVICGEGYIAPVHHEVQTFGATYTPKLTHHAVTDEDHTINLQHMGKSSAILQTQWNLEHGIVGGRTQTRTATPDYFPLCGAVPIAEDFRKDFALLGKNAQANIVQTGSYYPNLTVFAALGSRGMTYAPLCAEFLAQHIAGTPSCLPRAMVQQLNPARFLIRDIIKNRM